MAMSYSKGFSLIEIILVLALSSIIALIFTQNIAFSRKFIDTNPQIIFRDRETRSINRSLLSTNDFVFSDFSNSLGKRDCSLQNLEKYSNFITAPFLVEGEITSINTVGDLIITSLNSATSSDPDVLIVNSHNWEVISTLNTGPGVSGIVIQGHYLFLANTSVNGQFQAVDISNPGVPILVKTFKIPGSNSTNSRYNPIATSISSSVTPEGKARIFLGTRKSDLGEVFVADFDGTNFSYIDSYKTGSVVNDVFAHMTGVWVTSPSDDELFHYSASGTKDYTYNANGLSGNGNRIDILGNELKILGRTYGREELVQVDGPLYKIGGSIIDVVINAAVNGEIHVLVLANIGGDSVLQVWRTSDSKLDKSIKEFIFPIPVRRIACNEKSILIGTASSSAPFIILTP